MGRYSNITYFFLPVNQKISCTIMDFA